MHIHIHTRIHIHIDKIVHIYSRHLQFSTSPSKKGAGSDVTFTPFTSTNVGDPYITPEQRRREYEREKKQKMIVPTPFKPSNPTQRGRYHHICVYSQSECISRTSCQHIGAYGCQYTRTSTREHRFTHTHTQAHTHRSTYTHTPRELSSQGVFIGALRILSCLLFTQYLHTQ